jgi:hypothetical protein
VIDKISRVDARMFSVIDNRLRFIKHIHNKFFDGLDLIMTRDFYQTFFVKSSWIFQNMKDNVNALTPFFWQTYDQCYQLNKFMQQFDMFFIQTLNKICTTTKRIGYSIYIDNHPTILLFHIFL